MAIERLKCAVADGQVGHGVPSDDLGFDEAIFGLETAMYHGHSFHRWAGAL